MLFGEMGFRYIGPLDGHDSGLDAQEVNQAQNEHDPFDRHTANIAQTGMAIVMMLMSFATVDLMCTPGF